MWNKQNEKAFHRIKYIIITPIFSAFTLLFSRYALLWGSTQCKGSERSFHMPLFLKKIPISKKACLPTWPLDIPIVSGKNPYVLNAWPCINQPLTTGTINYTGITMCLPGTCIRGRGNFHIDTSFSLFLPLLPFRAIIEFLIVAWSPSILNDSPYCRWSWCVMWGITQCIACESSLWLNPGMLIMCVSECVCVCVCVWCVWVWVSGCVCLHMSLCVRGRA